MADRLAPPGIPSVPEMRPPTPATSTPDLHFAGSTPSGWIVACVALVQVGYVLLAPFDRLALYVNDDAYYFVMVARGWLEAGYPSLDGVTPTNGFQPLWQLLQLPLAAVAGRDLHLRLALLLGGLLFQGGLLGMAAGLRRTVGGRTALAFLLLFEANVLLSWGFALNGMESSLQVALLGAVVARLTSPGRIAGRQAVVLGSLVGLYGVTRLDGLALVPCVAAFVLWRERRLRTATPIVLLGLAPALAAMVASQLWLGTPVPVSGRVKLEINRQMLRADGADRVQGLASGAGNLARSGYYVASRVAGGAAAFAARATGVADRTTGAVAGVIGVAAAIAGLAMLLRRHAPVTLAPFAVVAASVAIRLAFFAVAYPLTFHLYDWYFADAVLLVAACVATPFAAVLRVRAVALATTFVAFANAACFASDTANLAHTRPVLDAARYVSSRPELAGTRVASWDAGLVAFVLANPVTNLDGLVNSPAFLRDVVGRRRPLVEYLRDEGVTTVVNLVPGGFKADDSFRYRGLSSGSAEVLYLSPSYVAPFGEVRRAAVFRVR